MLVKIQTNVETYFFYISIISGKIFQNIFFEIQKNINKYYKIYFFKCQKYKKYNKC